MELASRVSEVPNDVYTTISQNLIVWATLSHESCKLIGWFWEIIGQQFWWLTYPINFCNNIVEVRQK